MPIDTKWVCDQVDKVAGMHLIDIGSFDGNITKLLSATFPDSSVHSIEADPTNFKFLRKSCKGVANIICHNVAIGQCNCDTEMYIMKHRKYNGLTSQSNSLYKGFVAGKTSEYQKVVVNGMTMQQFCLANNIERIGLLKINCEGCEYKIFKAEGLGFLRFTDVISLAMHGKELFNEFEDNKIAINKILAKDFRCIYGQPLNSPRPAKKRWPHVLQVWKRRGMR